MEEKLGIGRLWECLASVWSPVHTLFRNSQGDQDLEPVSRSGQHRITSTIVGCSFPHFDRVPDQAPMDRDVHMQGTLTHRARICQVTNNIYCAVAALTRRVINVQCVGAVSEEEAGEERGGEAAVGPGAGFPRPIAGE